MVDKVANFNSGGISDSESASVDNTPLSNTLRT